jgi:hypothetical protein
VPVSRERLFLVLQCALFVLPARAVAQQPAAACTMSDMLQRGECEISSGRALEAVVLFRHAVGKDPKPANCGLAAALAKLGRYEDAQVHLRACRSLPAAERPQFAQSMAQQPQKFAPQGRKPSPPADCDGCGEMVLVLPSKVEPGVVLEEVSLVSDDSAERAVFSSRETIGTPNKLAIWVPPGKWRVRVLWKRGHQLAYVLSEELGATEIAPLEAELGAPDSDAFSDSPVPPQLFTAGLELYLRGDVAPLSPRGGAANVGLAYLLGHGFEPAVAAAVSPQLFGVWLGAAEFQPISPRVKLGVLGGVPWFLARLADGEPRLPQNFAGVHLAAAARFALGNGRPSLFFAAGGQYYPSLRAEHFRRTLLVFSLGFQYGL